MQNNLMKFDPAYGNANPYPSHAQQWREHHGASAWMFNPWTGKPRLPGDVGTDPFGVLIVAPGQALAAAH